MKFPFQLRFTKGVFVMSKVYVCRQGEGGVSELCTYTYIFKAFVMKCEVFCFELKKMHKFFKSGYSYLKNEDKIENT